MHTNKINKKRYIGITSRINDRFGKNGEGYLRKTNEKYNQPYFAHAILKYGWDNFEHDILYQNLTHEEANKYEKELINKYETRDPKKGYNIREGGSNGALSDETKQKLREKMKGRYVGEKNPFWGKHHSEDTLKILREKGKQNCRDISGEKNPMYHHVYTEEELLNKSLKQKGKHHSEETKRKISDSNKEYYKTHTHHCKGIAKTDKQKKHMSEVMKNIKKDENGEKI